MFKALTMTAVLMLAAVLVAQDAAPAGPVTTPYGQAQYRLRLRMFNQTPLTGDAYSTLDYANQLGFLAGLKVKVNDEVFMQFQAGNDAISTEAVSWSTNNWGAVGHTKGVSPYFHLAYAKYTSKMMYIVAGIQPVASNGPLDLVERSMIANNYKEAGLVTWIVGTNNGMAGLKLGAPILKEGFKLGAELFTSVTATRSQTLMLDAKSNPSSVMLLLDLPMSVSALTLTPQAVAIVNRNYNSTTEKGDHEVGGGFAASYKVMDGFSVTACLGVAMVANTNSGVGVVTTTKTLLTNVDTLHNNALYKTTYDTAKEYTQQGIIGGLGATYKVGPGNAIIDFKYSSDENTSLVDSKSSYIYFDGKYGWDVNKNFQIMPRVRIFLTQFDKLATTTLESKMETRPEVIFTGKF
ncbi:MAG: hypothetical protein V1913_14215 [Fibrobacterota bacterium]